MLKRGQETLEKLDETMKLQENLKVKWREPKDTLDPKEAMRCFPRPWMEFVAV